MVVINGYQSDRQISSLLPCYNFQLVMPMRQCTKLYVLPPSNWFDCVTCIKYNDCLFWFRLLFLGWPPLALLPHLWQTLLFFKNFCPSIEKLDGSNQSTWANIILWISGSGPGYKSHLISITSFVPIANCPDKGEDAYPTVQSHLFTIHHFHFLATCNM